MSWDQLIAYREDTDRGPEGVACPRDGEPLRDGPHGEKFCRYCGYGK